MTGQKDTHNLNDINLNDIDNLISNGQFKEALTILDNLAKTDPNNPHLFLLGGNCYGAMQSFEQAILCYKEALKLQPDFAEAHNNLGVYLKEIGELEEALSHAKKAVKIKPDFAAAHNNLGICLYEVGRPEEAHVSYKRALKIKPDYADTHNNIGNIYKDCGQVDEAITSYKKAIELDPNCSGAFDNLGATYSELGRNEEANEFYAKARGYNKDFEQGLSLFGDGNFTEAIKLFEKSQFADWKTKTLECHYRLKEFDMFREKLINYTKNERHIQRSIAALSAHYAHNLKTDDPYNFCPNPLKFVCHEKIPELLENNNQLTNELIKDIKTAGVLKREYQYLSHGTDLQQSGGHLFKRSEKSFKKLSDALINTIKRYYLRYQNEKNEFILSFPKKIIFSSSWSIEMKTGGCLDEHNHPEGWISGALYLAIPKENGEDGQEGAIELSSDFHQYPRLHDEFDKKLILPKVGDVVFFPSNVYHRTVPFKSNEERICIAFDVKHDVKNFGDY